MPRKTGHSRLQYGLFATPLEEMIAPDNMVRVIDAFADSLDLGKLGFKAQPSQVGASSYEPAVLLKIYLYGYLNRVRSSRRLELECQRNVEMMWLTERQTPCYHTISTFRTFQEKDEKGKIFFCHRKALKGVFRCFVAFCNGIDLLGKETIAVDGTKIAAQNSKKKHISADKIARKMERVEARIEEYMQELDLMDEQDIQDETPDVQAILLAIADMDERRQEIEQQQKMLDKAQAEDPSVTQICLTDPEARMLPINNEGMMQIAYNVQSAVDDKHCLIVHYSVENQKDLYLLGPASKAAKEALGLGADDLLEALADKGYHSGKGLMECVQANVTTYVAFPEQGYKDRPKGFQKPDFKYDKGKDEYTCPNHKSLKTSGTWHEKRGRQGHLESRYKLYRSPFGVCSECPFRGKCLSESNIRQRHGRTLERSEYEEAVIENRRRILRHRDKYKRRQAIVEHPFGTIKRSWGAYYTLLQGKEKVSGEMGIVFTAYNLRRVVSILGVKGAIEALKGFENGVWGLWRTVAAHTRARRQAVLWCAGENVGGGLAHVGVSA
jgi:transposase